MPEAPWSVSTWSTRRGAADSLIGSVPIAGDLFDVFFKSNRRNLDIILDHFQLSHDDLRRG
jgi:hypothetical protein